MKKKKGQRAPRDPERTKANILAVAKKEFADRGLHGARVDAIAARTRTSKRAIYYYFGGGKSARNNAKDQLFTAVLEKAYADIRAAEEQLVLDDLEPQAAILKLVEFTFDYYDAQPHFIRLETIENIFHGRHMRKSRAIGELTTTIIAKLDGVLARGREQGLFGAAVNGVDLHLVITSFCFFRASNHFTFGHIFQRDLTSEEEKQRLKRVLGEVVLGYLAQRPTHLEETVGSNLNPREAVGAAALQR